MVPKTDITRWLLTIGSIFTAIGLIISSTFILVRFESSVYEDMNSLAARDTELSYIIFNLTTVIEHNTAQDQKTMLLIINTQRDRLRAFQTGSPFHRYTGGG